MNADLRDHASGQEFVAATPGAPSAAAARQGGAAPDAPLGLSLSHISPLQPPRLYRLDARENPALASAKFYSAGSLVRVHIPSNRDRRPPAKLRREIDGFSAASRKRLLLVLNMIDRAAPLPLFVTLTYPGLEEFGDWETWKSHLDTLLKWLRRYSKGRGSAIWKLEAQLRGAPHFHLIIFGVPFLPWQAVACRWAEIVASQPEARVKLRAPKKWAHGVSGAAQFTAFVEALREAECDETLLQHLRAGTQTRQARSSNGVKAYASKLYLGKESAGFSGQGVGRFWGISNRAALPRTPPECVTGERARFVVFARTARKFASRQKGFSKRGTGSIDLMTENPEQWRRLLTAIFEGRVGLFGPLHTLEETRATDVEGHRAARAFAALTTHA